VTLGLAVALAAAVGSTAFAVDDASTAGPASSDVPSEHGADDVDPLAGADLDVLQGEAAVAELVSSGDLDDVAADAGVAPGELVDELVDDSSLFLTDDGTLGYAEALPLTDVGVSSSLLSVPLGTNVFALGSKPMSPRVIYLDFDGHVATDPAWTSVGAPPRIASAPFDIDGVPGFSATEQALIFEVWQRVSEDYLPFDVNVTTVDPGVEALRKTGPTDAAYGQRMVITPTNWVGSNTLGVALLGSFDEPEDRPAYVFTSSPGASSAKTMAEAASHEAGHTLGLLHDARPGASYYDGHGIWAPIMGRSIDPAKPVTQWSRGEYAGADNQQDDLALIADYTGFRPDDHGGDGLSATVVGSSSTTSGFIGRSGERDVFSVQAGPGAMSVTLRPPPAGATWSNLLARLVVRNGAGAVVASGTPATASSWDVTVTATIPADRYTIEVEPVGWLTAVDGFTTYGSLGAYELAVAVVPGAAPPPPSATTFTPISPNRLVDTRPGQRLGAGRQVVVQVTDGVTVPTDATAAVFSIAAVGPAAQGYLTAYPCSDQRPETSTVNYVAGQTVANTTIAALSSAGQLCVWTYADTDVLVDITGWLGPSGSSRFAPTGPTRVVDTRSAIGGVRLAPRTTLTVDLNGVVPAGTTAVALNATAVGAAAPAYLTVFPCGPLPPTSTVNYAAGEARPNNVIVGLSAGRVCVYSHAETDVLIDLTGAFGPTGLSYKPTVPTRVLDTRQTQSYIPAGEAVGYDVTAPALGADQPAAAFVNVTAADHLAPGYVTTYDCVMRRETSTLNQQVGQVVANGANVPLSGVQSCAWFFGGGHLIVDVNGWWIR
jgi:hypothetical protein